MALGVPMAVVDAADALSGAWRAFSADVDVVRVQDPPAHLWRELASAGFHPKPQVLTWRAAPLGSEEEFVARLSGKDRQNLRTARRHADGLLVRTEVVDAELLDEFLPIYEAGIARMKHGWAVAKEQKDKVLADADRYFAVCMRSNGTLVGASINEESHVRSEVRARFSATLPDQRQSSLAKVLYLEVIEVARQRGFSWVSLGSDPNLYGHLAKPGLFGFKNRLGFAAVPSHVVDPGSGSDQADRVVGLSALSDPTFFLAYAHEENGIPKRDSLLRLEMFTSEPDVDVRPYTADYLGGVRINQVGTSS
ncbi:GNAT family N-acetyltransferase [Lentzea sp. NPDC059081]|uniref:GNAT family N-acetyltransferase n=1 Tax=Lentzea sp. NPDC059081 TaxID=3346719 RepID=UPI0036A02EB2